jgi:hypothetical protein
LSSTLGTLSGANFSSGERKNAGGMLSADSRATVLKTKLSFLKAGQGTVHILCEHLSQDDESACHPKPKYLRQVERNPFDGGQRFGERQAQSRYSKWRLTSV